MKLHPDLLGTLKRLLAATPEGAYAAPTMPRRMLVEIIETISSLQLALSAADAGPSDEATSGMADQLLSNPED